LVKDYAFGKRKAPVLTKAPVTVGKLPIVSASPDHFSITLRTSLAKLNTIGLQEGQR